MTLLATGIEVGVLIGFLTSKAFLTAVLVQSIMAVGTWAVYKVASWLRGDGGNRRATRQEFKRIVRSAVTPVRWVLGRRRVSGVMCYFSSRGRDAYMALCLSEGECDSIEKFWVNGKEVEFARTPLGVDKTDGYLLTPVEDDEFHGKLYVFEHFKGDGTQGVEWRANLGGSDRVVHDNGQIVEHPYPCMATPDEPLGYPFQDPQGTQGTRFDPSLCSDGGREGWDTDSGEVDASGVGNPQDSRPWTAAHKLEGISWVGIRLFQPAYEGVEGAKRFWSYLPEIQFLVKGIKVTWPGQQDPTWTENAAALRHWFETERRGRPASAIKRSEFDAAYSLCEEDVTVDEADIPSGYDSEDYPRTKPRYSVNGVFHSGEDLEGVEARFDAAWAGQVVEVGGEFRFRPGMDRTPEFTIDEGSFVEEPTLSPWPDLQTRFNVIKVSLPQSASNDFTELSLDEFVDQDALDLDVIKRIQTVEIDFVNDPLSAGRLGAVLLRQGRERRTLRGRLKPGDIDATNSPLRMLPGSVLRATVPKYGLTDFRMYVSTMRINEDFTVNVLLVEDHPGTYDDTVVLPELPGSGVSFPTEPRVPEIYALVLDEIAEVGDNGATNVFLKVSWPPVSVEATVLRFREKAGMGEEDNPWTYLLTNHTPFPLGLVTVGKTYEVEGRHILKAGVGGSWTAAERLIGGDVTPPAAPTGLDVDFRSLGYRAKWVNPEDKDFDVACVYEAEGAAAVFADSVLVGTLKADSFEQVGKTAGTVYRVWLKAKDYSGNLSAVHGPVNVTPVGLVGGGTWHHGSGAPTSTDPSDAVAGDLYVNQDNGRLWQLGTGGWVDTGIDITPMGGELHIIADCNTPAASVGVNGDKAVSVAATCAGTVWAKESGAWTESGRIAPTAGALKDEILADPEAVEMLKGGRGETGDKGIKGGEGPQGLRGERGEMGDEGIKGGEGPQGLRGERGEMGDEGIKGGEGPTGIQGERGDDGNKGNEGGDGPQGIQGERGDDGSVGSQGAKGVTGIQGPAGVVGADGDVVISFYTNAPQSTDAADLEPVSVLADGRWTTASGYYWWPNADQVPD